MAKKEMTPHMFMREALPLVKALKIAADAMQTDDSTMTAVIAVSTQLEAAAAVVTQLRALVDNNAVASEKISSILT